MDSQQSSPTPGQQPVYQQHETYRQPTAGGPSLGEDHSTRKTSTGLTANVAGLLCYLGGIISGIIFIVIEKEDEFVRFHAFQSTFVSAALFVINTVLGIIPLLNILAIPVMALLGIGLWLYMMYKAYQGERFKLPLVGELAQKQVRPSPSA